MVIASFWEALGRSAVSCAPAFATVANGNAGTGACHSTDLQEPQAMSDDHVQEALSSKIGMTADCFYKDPLVLYVCV